MQREAILLTPGPLTTTLRTKLAMLRDWGSWDSEFIAMTARVRKSLLNIVHGHETHVVVPLQGSGTFSVEAAVATLVPSKRPHFGFGTMAPIAKEPPNCPP
jgi:2-aminoethylphosphonate-pyruvate transaminase